MTKKEAREFLEKKLVFNEQMEEWEKESQSEFFLELLNNWSKEDIITTFLWFENLIMKQNEEYENMKKQNINELQNKETTELKVGEEYQVWLVNKSTTVDTNKIKVFIQEPATLEELKEDVFRQFNIPSSEANKYEFKIQELSNNLDNELADAIDNETAKVEETKEKSKFNVNNFYFTVSNATAYFDKENNHERPSVTFKVNDQQKVRIGLKPKTFIEKLANDQYRFSGKNIDSIKAFTNSLKVDAKQTVEKLSSFDLKQFENVQMIHFTKVLEENKDLLKSKELESEQEKSDEMEL